MGVLGFLGTGLTKKELDSFTYREKFSDYLPYIAYDREEKLYLCQDNTVGYLWECCPLTFAGEKTFTSLQGLLSGGYPKGTVLQVSLYADNYIKPYVDMYKSLKIRQDEVVKEVVTRYSEYLLGGVHGLAGNAGIPVRNFRLFVSIKFPVDAEHLNTKEFYELVRDRLTGAGLMPVDMPPEELILFLRMLFNNFEYRESLKYYDEDVPINKQIILNGTRIQKHFKKLKIGDVTAKCITPKNFPKEIDPLFINALVGGWEGIVSDNDQLRTPFLLTVNVVFEDLRNLLHTKCNFILQQQAAGSFAPSIKRKQEEYLWAVDNLDKGVKFYRIVPILWLFNKDESVVDESSARARRIWEGYGFIMQEDGGILPILLVSALPFGLYNVEKNVSKMDRDFIAHAGVIAKVLPVQADISGFGMVMPFVGRKGQILGVDIFDRRSPNHNVVISATTGSGKSFLVNYMVFNMYASGAIVRIVDIGGSYKKLVKMLGAKYLDVGDKDLNLCMNPFSFIKVPEDDIPTIVSVVSKMVYTAEKKIPSQTETTILKNAVQWAYSEYGSDAGIDGVYEYLNTFPRHAVNFDFDCPEKQECAQDIKTLAHTLAFNIYEFTSNGMYGRYFNGPATFDISKDELVVLELEKLKTMPDLFEVVTLQVINAIASDLYLSDRSRPRFIVFDEAWQFLNDASTLKSIIEEGYRKARKYHGSFAVVVQSDLDMIRFGDVGKVIYGNSAFKFKLESSQYNKAKQDGLLDYDDFVMKILTGVRSNKPKYSEIFIDTPFNLGVVRLCVDPFSYYVYTSDPRDYIRIENIMQQKGISYAEAIKEILG